MAALPVRNNNHNQIRLILIPDRLELGEDRNQIGKLFNSDDVLEEGPPFTPARWSTIDPGLW